jgi:hypothetical protein
VNVFERLAPYVKATDDESNGSFEPSTAAVAVLEGARPPGPYRPRHLAT